MALAYNHKQTDHVPSSATLNRLRWLMAQSEQAQEAMLGLSDGYDMRELVAAEKFLCTAAAQCQAAIEHVRGLMAQFPGHADLAPAVDMQLIEEIMIGAASDAEEA